MNLNWSRLNFFFLITFCDDLENVCSGIFIDAARYGHPNVVLKQALRRSSMRRGTRRQMMAFTKESIVDRLKSKGRDGVRTVRPQVKAR